MNLETAQIKQPIRILLVEDVAHDALAFSHALQHGDSQWDITHIDTGEEALTRLMAEPHSFDIVVADQLLTGMAGLDLFKELLASEIQLPLVLLTGVGSESLAVEALKAGVDEYLIKDPHQGYLKLLEVVLPEMIMRHAGKMESKRAEEERKKLIVELQEALAQIKTLRGIIPICSYCKKVRDDKGYWDQVEIYISRHTDAEFSHGLCPECYDNELSKINPNDSLKR